MRSETDGSFSGPGRADGSDSDGSVASGTIDSDSPDAVQGVAGPDETSKRRLVLACIPALLVGVFLRIWVATSPLMTLTSDEAVTALQARDVLDGTVRLIVPGNFYGGTAETFLFAPVLAIWHGPWPLRVLPAVLSLVAVYVLFRVARPLYGTTVAATVALVGWVTSGAIVVMFSRAYMGYTTGLIAQLVALGCAGRAMGIGVDSPSHPAGRLRWTALLGGFAAGVAVWGHPLFGVIAVIALAVPSVVHRRSWRNWWAPAALGGVVGLSPWLAFIARHGSPKSAGAIPSTYVGRLRTMASELLPRTFGLKTTAGDWVLPHVIGATIIVVLAVGGLVGLVVAVRRRGVIALPVAVAGFLAMPCLAIFAQLSFAEDARYALPLLPPLLIGLGAWLTYVPGTARSRTWLVVAVPVLWAAAFCVPVIHQQVGWDPADPNRGDRPVLDTPLNDTFPYLLGGAERAAEVLEDRGIHYLRGDYWGVYPTEYFSDGRVVSKPDYAVRFEENAAKVDRAPPEQVAFVYPRQAPGAPPPSTLLLDPSSYDVVPAGGYDVWVPR